MTFLELTEAYLAADQETKEKIEKLLALNEEQQKDRDLIVQMLKGVK